MNNCGQATMVAAQHCSFVGIGLILCIFSNLYLPLCVIFYPFMSTQVAETQSEIMCTMLPVLGVGKFVECTGCVCTG